MRVPRPETVAPEMRGRTTQTFVSSTRNSSVLGAICAVAITPWRSADRRIFVLPASSPSADRGAIVIFGPSLRILVTATQTPVSAATMGTIQTTESRVRFLTTVRASPTWGSGGSRSGIPHLSRAQGIPDQSGIERLDREHRQHHDSREEDQPQRRLHRHEWLELHERGGEGVDEYVDHRPAPDELHD